MKQARLIVHPRSYNANNGSCCTHKDLQCKQWLIKQGRLIVHTRSYKANIG
ncbi:hypothetical protein KSS87_003764 [Heliosperma pusillum]|nr:hypothetical protein KSS87_003764 [Heliosperma pusillum]